MGRCSYDLLNGLEPALEQIRKLPDIKETKPGIFYLKSQGFMHFHEKDGSIWADVKNGKDWGQPIDVPPKVTKKFLSQFVNSVTERYFTSGGKDFENKKTESSSVEAKVQKARIKNSSRVTKN